MRFYEDETMKYSTEELTNMDAVEVDDPYMITNLSLLGFDYCTFNGKCYFTATPKFLYAIELLKNK